MIAVGMVLDRLGAVARDSTVVDRSRYSPGWRVRTTYSLEPLELRSRQPRELPVNIAHDRSRVVGAVRHLEVGADGGDVWAVADVRDGELPGEDELALYFSLEGQRGGHDGAILSALAITPSPATVGLSPLRLFPGEVRELEQAATLRLRNAEPFLARLLERARAATKQRRYGEPLVVEDRRASLPPVEVRDHGQGDEVPIAVGIRWWPPYPGVLSVR